MKKFIIFTFQTISAFIESFLMPLQSQEERENSKIKVDVYKPVAGKKAVVTQSVSSNSGEVDLYAVRCSARLSKDCSFKSVEPGEEVTIEYLENDILYVFQADE